MNIIGISIDDLLDIISKAIKDGMDTAIENNRFGSEFKDEILDRNEVARLLKITPDHVSYLYNKKVIPGTKIGKEYKFLKSKLLKVIDNGKNKI